MRDLSDRFHQLISFMKPIWSHPSAKLSFGSEMRMRGWEWQFVRFTWGLCPVSRQIWISSQTSHICYNLLQYVTQRHTRSRDTHYISFHFVCQQDYDSLPADLSNYLQICIHLHATIFSLLWLVSIPQLAVIFPSYCLYCERYDFNWTWGWVWFMQPVHCLGWGLQFSIKWATE